MSDINRFVAKDSSELIQNIWFNPRETFRYLITYTPKLHVTLFLALEAIARGFDKAEEQNAGNNSSLITIILVVTIVSGLIGYFTLLFYAYLIQETGFWIGGKAKHGQIKTVLAWSSIPSILTLLIVIFRIIIYQEDTFKSKLSFEPTAFTSVFESIVSLCQIALGGWTIVLFLIGISEVQKFSIGKAILNILLASLCIVVPILLLVFLFMTFS